MSFKIMRERAGLTQLQLSEMIGVPQSTIASWETNRAMPRVKRLVQLAKLLNCSVEELLETDGK